MGNKAKLLYLLPLICFYWKPSSAQMSEIDYSSTFEMKRLLEAEVEFSKKLSEYADTLESRAKSVRAAFKQIFPHGPPKATPESAEAYVANPLNALGVMRRTSYDFVESKVKSLLHDDATEPLLALRRRLSELTAGFPQPNHMHEGLGSLGLLQEAYALDPAELAEGRISFGGQTLTSDYTPDWLDVVDLGLGACKRGWWDTGIGWLEMALDKYPGGQEDLRKRVLEELAKAKQTHDQLLDKRGQRSSDHRCNPQPFDAKLRKKKKFKRAAAASASANANATRDDAITTEGLFPLFTEPQDERVLSENFHRMCRHGPYALRTPDMDKDLRCWRLTHKDPYLRLGPFKLEEKSVSPIAVVLHDFMSAAEMRHFKDFAGERLKRSGTGHDKNAKGTLSNRRTSKQAWLEDKHFNMTVTTTLSYDKAVDPAPIPFDWPQSLNVKDPVAFGVAKRIQNATGLKFITPFGSEPFQVANYGLGGQYSSHVDCNGYFEGAVTRERSDVRMFEYSRDVGDRMATFMVYLSDVEMGGATVFPATGVYSPAVAGDAIFWINLKRDMTKDRMTHHGGCPVIVGSKWITNKWIQSNDQFLALPCALQKGGTFDLLNQWRSENNQR